MTEVRIIADSIGDNGQRLTTMQLKFHRIVLAEFNTHRMFCATGDSLLEFDLPSGQNECKRNFTMRLDNFVEKWHEGAKERPNNPRKELDFSLLTEDFYTTKQIATLFGFSNASSFNKAVRDGELEATKIGKVGRWSWIVKSEDFISYWNRPTFNRQDITSRLKEMNIRQYNERTGKIQSSHVTDCWFSGEKEVYEIRANGFTFSGSKDHLIFTSDGWKTIGNLIPNNDKIAVRKFGKLEEDKIDITRLTKVDGIWRSDFNRRIKNTLYERQNGKCFFCKSNETEEVHHLIPVYENSSLANDINNVVLVCKECHNRQHEKQGWQGGTYLYGDFVKVNEITYRGIEPTYDLEIEGEFPNFLANGVVVHNSRNASSSRAIPVKTLLSRVKEDPAMPVYWGANQKGMQAKDELGGVDVYYAQKEWLEARDSAVKHVENLIKFGLHKQLANRILETWMWCYVVVTATEWNNFFNLRCHPDAQPEIGSLAKRMKLAIEESEPVQVGLADWHLPYVLEEDIQKVKAGEKDDFKVLQTLRAVSTARCARVSYKTHDGMIPSIEKDLELHDQLISSGHLSPTEHAAQYTGDYNFYGNFRGWKQYRKFIPNENIFRG